MQGNILQYEASGSCHDARSKDTPLPPVRNDAPVTDRRYNWLAAPASLAIIGLMGTGFGAAISGYWNTKLERQKFEFSLIQKALEAPDKAEAAKGLTFLVEAGLIEQFNAEKISALASNPNQLPTFIGAAIRDHFITVHDAKTVLDHLQLHTGPINDVADDAFRREIVDFQWSQHITPDGYVGPLTYAKMRDLWPEHFKQK